MADPALDLILTDLRKSVVTYYPDRGELRNLRVVGHTPKVDHMIYDVCADFDQGIVHGIEKCLINRRRGW